MTQDVLDKYAPDVVADLNSAVWDAIRVNGKLYGIPLQQIYVRQTGIRFNTELLNKYGFDPSTVKTLDDLDEYAATIKASEPDAVVIYNYGHLIYENMVNYLGYDVIVSNTTPGVVYYAAETPVVFNQFEPEEFKALCEKMREWNLAGYFPTDAVTGADSVGETDIRAIDSDPAHKPGGDITEGQLRGYDITGIAFGDCAMTTGAVQATITAVSATSKNVERAVAFINLLDSDPEVLNLICHGIEGTDYEFVGDKADGLIKPISDYPGMLRFLVGNVFNEYYTDASQVGTWPETAEINANAQASCILGFAFDSEPVATQIAQCSAVAEEYLPALNCGAVDVDTAEIRALLDEDGVPVQIVARERSCATSLIEEAMLLANECVAEWLADRDIEACYRVHEDPSPDSLHGAAVALAQLGIIDDRRAAGIALGSPDELQAAVDAAAGTANAPLVNTLLLRSMQRALYKPRNEGHFALAAPCYCHFTSPIRRYPDLVVHRVLKLQLAYEQLGGKDALVRTPRLIGKGRESLPRILPQICRACSDAERAADAASHATQKIKIAQYYEDRLGERYAGTVSWVSSMGLFVRLDLTQVEGLVSIKSLGNEWFEFDEDALTLTGADTGTRYELGQRVIIEVSRVNTTRGHLDFKLIH